MRILTTTLLLVACINGFAQIGAKTRQSSTIAGLWQNSQFGYQMTLMLRPDGTGEFDGEEIRYTAANGVLTLTMASSREVNTYNFTQNGNALTLSGGDLDQPVTFARAGADPSSTTTTTEVAQSAQSTSVGIDKALLGVWSGNNESMEFKPNGQVLYANQVLQYTVNAGHITLTTNQGSTLIAYRIDGNQMTMTINGQQYVYTRGQATAPTPSGARTVAQELVGKWCWINVTSTNSGGVSSDECITLQPNGTYSYYSERSMSVNDPSFAGGTNSQSSDSGTWWVQGDRLFYHSQTRGEGSYRLEKRNHPRNVNDPMIVLDGQAFVTAYQKAPWR